MKEINSAETYHTVTANTADSVTINAVNSLAYTDYVSGGVLEYNEPCDLTGITARMQIREKITSATTLIELTTENGKIVIDNTFKTITLVLSATDTSAFTFSSAVYSLELINGTEVTPFIFGSISLTSEITR
jgi:type V secretory pathway adhesin AidA